MSSHIKFPDREPFVGMVPWSKLGGGGGGGGGANHGGGWHLQVGGCGQNFRHKSPY